MTEFNRQIAQILHHPTASVKEKLDQLIQTLQSCRGTLLLNEHGKLEFISTTELNEALYPSSALLFIHADHGSDLGFAEIKKKEADLRLIRYLLRTFNEGILKDDMILFYENHILKKSYRKIHEQYGFSKTKCTASNARIYAFLEETLFQKTVL